MIGNVPSIDNWIPLRKHGSSGGTCRRWILDQDDYISNVEYTWHEKQQALVQILFRTRGRDERVLGRGDGK